MERKPTTFPASFTRWGIILYSAALVALAVQNLCGAETVSGLEPLPDSLPGRAFWATLNSLILLGGGLGIIVQKARGKKAVVPELALAVLLLLWTVLLQLPALVGTPGSGSLLTCLFEGLAIGSVAWTAAGIDSTVDLTANARGFPAWARRSGSIVYGISLPVFGVLHVIYWKYIIASMPSWLPWQMGWNDFIAVAFFVAGASIVSGIKARLAAIWTGIMFLSWVLVLHLPRTLAASPETRRAELTILLVALAMGGGAWVIAQNHRTPRPAEALPTSSATFSGKPSEL